MENRILRPASSTLQRIIGEQRTQARGCIFKKITSALSKEMIHQLDGLLWVSDEKVSPLQRLKEPPGKAATTAMKRLTDKLACIQETGVLAVDPFLAQ